MRPDGLCQQGELSPEHSELQPAAINRGEKMFLKQTVDIDIGVSTIASEILSSWSYFEHVVSAPMLALASTRTVQIWGTSCMSAGSKQLTKTTLQLGGNNCCFQLFVCYRQISLNQASYKVVTAVHMLYAQ